MEKTSQTPAKQKEHLVRTASFSLERLLSHIDPGPEQESEEFVRAVYEQRRRQRQDWSLTPMSQVTSSSGTPRWRRATSSWFAAPN